MRKVIITTAIALLISIMAMAQKRVAMLELVGEGATSMQKHIIRASLAEAITNTGTYTAFTRTDIDQILQEGDFQKGGMVNEKDRQRIDQMSGAELLCVIKLTIEGSDFFAECSLVEMKTGEITKTTNILMASSPNSKIQEGCVQLAAKLVGSEIKPSSGGSGGGNNNAANTNANQTNTDGEYAVLYIYRLHKLSGVMVNYDIHLDDEVICSTKNNWKTAIRVSNFGTKGVWARYGLKAAVSIDLAPGGVYYIRCGIKTVGATVPSPTLEHIDKSLGEREYNSIK